MRDGGSVTLYNEIFTLFINKINDYQLLSMEETDIEDICCLYLKSAVTKFKKCKTKLTRDDNAMVFLHTLSDEEKEILANLLMIEWLTPKIQNITNLKQYMGDTDFKFFSQANHLDALQRVRNTTIEETDGLIQDYLWNFETDIEELI